jgi:hypothetical protein
VFIGTIFVRGKIAGDGSVFGKVRVGEFLGEEIPRRNSETERNAPRRVCGSDIPSGLPFGRVLRHQEDSGRIGFFMGWGH